MNFFRQLFQLDQPDTRNIYDIPGYSVPELAAQGMACLVISSEFNELLGLCHRIAVMRAGELVTTLEAGEASEEWLMYHAAGVEVG